MSSALSNLLFGCLIGDLIVLCSKKELGVWSPCFSPFMRNLTYQSVHPLSVKVKGKGFPYSIPSVGSGADPGVQAVSLQVTVSHPPGSRLPLLSARPAVTSPAAEHHRPLAGTKLYCLVTEAHRCKQLA